MQRIIEQFGQKVEKGQEDVKNFLSSGSGVTPRQPDMTQTPDEGQAKANILKYYTAKGMDFTDVTGKTNAAVYSWGFSLGFNLFNGLEGFKFHGYFPKEEPNKIKGVSP